MLTMSEEKLASVAEHFRAVERRDPTVDELRFLDQLSKKANREYSSYTMTRLLTNDPFVAQTFADMMQKRSALSYEALPPATASELLSVATAYLKRSGKSSRLPHHTLILENRSSVGRIPASSVGCGISPSAHQLRILTGKQNLHIPETGDSLVLFLPKEGKSITDYRKRIGNFLNSYEQNAPWRYFGTILEGGLLSSVLQLKNIGIWLDISRLPHQGEDSLSYLTEAYAGCHFAILPHDTAKDVLDNASDYGIRTVIPATVMQEARLTLVRGGVEIFSMKCDFVRKFLHSQSITARLCDEAERTLQSIRHTPTSSAACSYLQRNNPTAPYECMKLQSTLCATAFCNPTYSFYRHALYTALCPILSLAAKGLSYDSQRLAIGILTPASADDCEKAFGELLSLLLGIYRTQAELGIPAAAVTLDTDRSISHPQTTVYSVAEGKEGAEVFSAVGNSVYCFTPSQDANGLPDFASVRTLLQELCQRAQGCSIVSARILCNESITDGLKKMSHDGLYCHIDGKLAAEGALPLAVLIECTKPLVGQVPIGLVCQKESLTVQEKEIPVLDIRSTLVWSSRAEFVILCKPGDLDAEVLADAVNQKGGHATLFVDDRNDAKEIARAMLGAHVLILCRGAHLAQTPHTEFALDVLLRAGGACWLIGEVGFSPLEKKAVRFAHAIPEDLIEQICK